ncbi:uncharacterized protein LOC133825746 [Humulus lupulus]|uniref:uncharacterized protein LOC133825746 n=1 Tax=Humulus lupulus TaxID=3486 RepID=UPI002B40788B|nr:uncharacterized protein LOC133825746 [Humulus lupulus]
MVVHEQNESVTHCLAGCRLVWPCWQQLGFDILAPSSESFQAWVRGSIFQLNDDQRCRFFMLCWAIWRRRNEWVWRKKRGSIQEILYVADCSLQNWIQAQDKELTPMPSFLSGEDGVSSWKKPPVGKLKINTDAAMFIDSQCFSFAGVARDEDGKVVEAISSCRSGVVSPEIAEAIGIREVLSWVKRKKWPNVMIETDSLLCVQALRSSIVMESYFGGIIDDCKLLCEKLGSVSISFVKRSANRAAHAIARAASVIADRVLTIEGLPSTVLAIVLEESI